MLAKLDCAWLKEQDKVKTKVFANKLCGWQELIDWSLKNTGLAMTELHFVMEATGIYHEQLATFLYEAGRKYRWSIQRKSSFMPKV
jgi:transposase